MPRVAASERDAYYEARRAELADVALRLWAERGFDQTSVAAIAREAGIAKGTFYLYFETKDALLFEVLRRNSLIPNVLKLIEDLGHKSLDEAVHTFVRGAWAHLCEHRDLVLVAMRELPTHLEQARQAVARVLVPSNRALARYIDSHIPIERSEQISSVICVRALIGMLFTVFLTQEILGAGELLPTSSEDVTNTIAELFLRGVTHAPQETAA